MEKRKSKLSKIIIQFEEVSEEKIEIEENLERLQAQLFTFVDAAKKNNDNMKAKDLCNIQKYVLDILKTFTEINSQLEILLEENPLQLLDREDKNVNKQKDAVATTSITAVDTNSDVPTFNAESTLNKDNFDPYYKKVINHSKEHQNNLSHSKVYQKTDIEYNNVNVLDCTGKECIDDNCLQSCDASVPTDSSSSSEDIIVKPIIRPNNSDESEQNLIIPISKPEHQLDSPDIISDVTHSRYTTLEKLNNYKLQPQEEPSDRLFPDIKLKPTVSVIQNFTTPVCKKKSKNKKKKKNIDTHFTIMDKNPPQVGDECLFSHIVSPSEFYIHLVDDTTDLLDPFIDEIHEHFIKNDDDPRYESKREALGEVGTFCIAFVEKFNIWYRAEILEDSDEDDENVLIQMVDYGIKVVVHYKYLRKLPEEFSYLPKLAVRCCFVSLCPPDSTRSNRLVNWPESSIQALRDLSGLSDRNNTDYFFQICYAEKQTFSNATIIDLYPVNSGNEESTLGQFLLDEGYAVQFSDEFDENNVELEEYLQDVNYVEVDNINEAVIGYDPRDEARICRFTKADGTCFKGKNCKLEHIPFSKDGTTTDKELVFTEAMYSIIVPPLNTTTKILITGYIDTCRFFAQIVERPCRREDFNSDIDYEMNNLLTEMNSTNMIKTYESFKISPALGEIVIVKHWNWWSRAKVRDILMGDDAHNIEVQVYLVDFGETRRLPLKNIRKIKPHLLKLPFQAVECYIHNYEFNKNCVRKEAEEFFYANMYLKNFTATIMSKYVPLKINLKSKNEKIVVGQTLEEKGYAVRRKLDIHILDDFPMMFD